MTSRMRVKEREQEQDFFFFYSAAKPLREKEGGSALTSEITFLPTFFLPTVNTEVA